MRYQTIKQIATVAGVVAGVMLATSALAQYFSSSPPTFPVGWYISPPSGSVTLTGPNLLSDGIASVVLSNLVHTPGHNISSQQIPGGWVETFDSTLTGAATIYWSAGGSTAASLFAGGPDQNVTVTITNGYTPGTVGGPWGALMTIMDWTNAAVAIPGDGDILVDIRCLGAPGLTTVTELSPTLYRSDSFFDVTPEISLDNTEWTTSDQMITMTLVPEPSGLALLGLGVLCLAIKTRRGRK